MVLKEPTVTGSIVAVTYHQEEVSPADNENGDSTDNGDRWTPTIEYKVAGTAYHIDGPDGKSVNDYKVGTPVDIRYDAANPAKGQIDSFASIWLFPIAFILFGLPFSLIGLALLRSTLSGQLQVKS